MKLVTLAGFIVAAGLSLNAYAVQVDMKPGLWEHTFKLNEGSIGAITGVQQEQVSQAMDEMKKQMANMSPEQRKMMEDMMAKQGIKISDKGIDMTSQNLHISKDGTIIKVCVTQAQIDSGELPQAENCEQKVTQVSANVFKSTFACKGEHPVNGEGQIVFQSNKAYTGTTKVTTEVNKKVQTIEGTQSGKWLSSDCGDVKPLPPKTK
ncbi:hypothetical protein GCM10011613_18220 [Cellvibrio zantedeschiae]|uniref:DUF3617 domain-containing protein n=2 Tax=Cellvibrio zantedeschiae TaxID=1237077 RepID=A0ABQ3B4Q1_9GAMM|nr:hypothetical protein GCM10011613_18220 [Cellvibrio zantedeschiae]